MGETRESPAVRAFRGALNANGEFGSGLALVAMAAAVPAMLDPSLFVGNPLVPLSSRSQGLFNLLAGAFLTMGIVQVASVLLDRRAARVLSCYLASGLWTLSLIGFVPIHFYGSATLGVSMIVVNVLAAARGRLQIEQWERVACGKAGKCEHRVPPTGDAG